MIRFLPTPYPDELLWSVFARAARRLRAPSHAATAKILTGSRNAIAVVDLPTGLEKLCAQLGAEHGKLDADQLIARHTLLPIYAPFLSESSLDQIRADMRGDERGAAIHCETGIMASRVQMPTHLRLCPVCHEQDIHLYGESYWRRTHQVAGVEVCPHHAVFLECTSVTYTGRKARHAYFPMRFRDPSLPIRHLDPKNSEHSLLLRLAEDFYWLLDRNHLWAQKRKLKQTYLEHLAERGLAVHGGRLRLNAIHKEFYNRYSIDSLKLLQCGPSLDGRLRWILRLLRSRQATQAPIHHLVLIHFLGKDAANLFYGMNNFGIFGTPSWPCLNPVCLQYGHEIIAYHEIGYDEKGVPIGTFRCSDCGYTYVRRGPDRAKLASKRPAWIKDYGACWEDALRSCWSNQRISLRAMARKLGVDPLTAKRAAARLNLPFPRAGKRLVHKERACAFPIKEVNPHLLQRRYRAHWELLGKVNPELSRSEIRRLSPVAYMWLYRHDREWLLATGPNRQASGCQPSSRSTADWAVRDMVQSGRVRQVHEQMREESGRPTHMCTASLARRLGILAWIQKHADKLPLTIAAIHARKETREAFAIRRIAWVVTTDRWKNFPPTCWRLMRLAGIRSDLSSNRQVLQELECAVSNAKISLS